jgi:hypothetical protein
MYVPSGSLELQQTSKINWKQCGSNYYEYISALSGLESIRTQLNNLFREFCKKMQQPSNSIIKLLPRRYLESLDILQHSSQYTSFAVILPAFGGHSYRMLSTVTDFRRRLLTNVSINYLIMYFMFCIQPFCCHTSCQS